MDIIRQELYVDSLWWGLMDSCLIAPWYQQQSWWRRPVPTLLWRHNGDQCVLNCELHDCILNRLFGRWSKKTSKLRVTGLRAGNSPETGEFPAQMASNAENISIWWRHHDLSGFPLVINKWMPWYLIFVILLICRQNEQHRAALGSCRFSFSCLPRCHPQELCDRTLR